MLLVRRLRSGGSLSKDFNYICSSYSEKMAAPKGSKKFWNPVTNEVTIRLDHPGDPWILGIPAEHKTPRGSKVWHDPQSGKHIRRSDDPGPPWVKGWHPNRFHDLSKGNKGRKQTAEEIAKRTTSLIERHKECGLSEKETSGHKTVQEKLKGRTIPLKQRKQISRTLSGRKTGYNAKRSRSAAEFRKSDTVYLLKVTTPEGIEFGKWGCTRLDTCKSRWKELQQRGFTVEVLGLFLRGTDAPRLEEWVGSKLCPYPVDLKKIYFGGYTETFEWNAKTKQILEEIINELEKDTAP